MGRLIFIALGLMVSIGCSKVKEDKYRVVDGEGFSIEMPLFMEASENISSEGLIEYMHKDHESYIYSVVYKDSKTDYKESTTLKDYYQYIANDILTNYLDYGSLKYIKDTVIDGLNAIQFEISGSLKYDEVDNNSYFLETVIEADSAFYEIRSWTNYRLKSKHIEDMQHIAYSFASR